MKELVWIATAFALLALSSPLLGQLDTALFAPDVALLTALYAGSRTGLLSAVVTAFVVGLLKDGLALSAPVGVYTEINVLVVLAARLLERRVDLHSAVPLMATAAGMTLGGTLAFLGLEAVFHRSFQSYGDVLRMALPLALMTMLLAPVHFALLDRLSRRFDAHARSPLLPLRR